MAFRFLAAIGTLQGAACAPLQVSGPAQQQVIDARHARSGPSESEVRTVVEEQIVARYGVQALARAQAAGSSLLAASLGGHFAVRGPVFGVAVRSPTGWTEVDATPLPRSASAEIDRLLADPALWREPPFWPQMDCPDAGAVMMIVRHRGRVRVTRQACGTNGLTGRLSEAVLSASAAPR